MGEWSEMDLAEAHRSGLLWHANRSTFWPLGLALAVEVDGDGHYVRLYVKRLDPFEPVASGDRGDEEADRADRFAAWMRERFAREQRGP